MKFTIEIDLENLFEYEDVEAIIKDRILEDIVSMEVSKFKLDKQRYSYGDLESRMNDKVNSLLDKLEVKKYDDLLDKLADRVERKHDFQERIFSVKPFNDLTKENEEYLMEVVDKAIAKRFK
jgi:phosphoribosylaminoimidazole carboxylase (NCAIR synthetase)